MTSKNAAPRILCIGMATIDHVFRLTAIPREPTKVRAKEYVRISGGMAANAAVAVARLGGQAAYWGPVGRDPNGEDILAELAAERVDTSGVLRVPQPSAVSAIMVDRAGERLVCGYSDPAAFDSEAALPLARLSGFEALHVDCRWWRTGRHALQAALERGLPSVFDGDLAPVNALVALAPLASHAIFSERGLASVASGDTPEAQLADFARNHGRDGALLGVTLGAGGFVWRSTAGSTAGRTLRIGVPPVTAIDTLGAGDVFHGAYAYALATGMDEPACARFASATAALKCTRFGGRSGTPSHAEVDALLATWPEAPRDA
jgi:sulfofructose kinase